MSGEWDWVRKVGPVWDDDKFPATTNRIDIGATRYSFDHVELGIEFDMHIQTDGRGSVEEFTK